MKGIARVRLRDGTQSWPKIQLIVRKICQTIPDAEAAKRGPPRIVDESGEDYLFPTALIAAIEIPKDLKPRLAT